MNNKQEGYQETRGMIYQKKNVNSRNEDQEFFNVIK